MAEAAVHSLRLNRLESRRLALALALSLMAHLFAWGGYEFGEKLGLWQPWHWPAWLHRLEKIKPPPVVQNSEEPLEFVTVDQPSTEIPKNAKYYSSQNSIAANPDANRDTEKPKLNGRQTDAPMTENVLRPQFSKSQSGAEKQEANDQKENSETKPSLSVGDLIMGQPNDSQQPYRPRTLNQARAMMANQTPGVQLRQDGGTHRHSFVPSFDVKQTQFGDYDAAIYDAMQQYWDDELDQINYDGYESGKVVLQFHLNYDGRITDMKVLESTVGETMTLMCELAVLRPAPYAPWPSDMRRMIGDNYRETLITFYYY
jgi:hypothetical protein